MLSEPSAVISPAVSPLPGVRSLFLAWIGLLTLTAISLGLGAWFHESRWLPLPVAAIVWLKGSLVARHFLESPRAHPLIVWLLRVFVGFAPAALVLTAFFGREFARWATL